MADACKSKVWLVNMGTAGKVRLCLLLTDYPADDELAMVTGEEWKQVLKKLSDWLGL